MKKEKTVKSREVLRKEIMRAARREVIGFKDFPKKLQFEICDFEAGFEKYLLEKRAGA